MKKILMTALLLGSLANVNASGSELAGTWRSTDVQGTALHGTIRLQEDGRAALLPDGNPAITGTWHTVDKTLVLEMPPYGTASMQWKFEGTALVLEYENGEELRFRRLSPATP